MNRSSTSLSHTLTTKILNRWHTLLADFRKPDQVAAFLTTFLSENEQLTFAKRLTIAYCLYQQMSYQEISDKLQVSSATISAVATNMEKPGMIAAMKKIAREEWAEQLTQKLFDTGRD